MIERSEKGYNVGGEQSGHIIFSDYSTTGDGLILALQVLAVVQKVGNPVSEVCHRFDPLPQVLRNVRFNGGRPLRIRSSPRRSPTRPPGWETAGGSSYGLREPNR